jgi:hypothetical protein
METRHISPDPGDLLVLLGTTKGAFFLRSTNGRQEWDIAGPFCQGESVYAMCLDTRNGRHRLWAAARNEQWATELVSTDDFGRTWNQPKIPLIAYPADCGLAVERIWQLVLGTDADAMYCGVAPSGLFVSRDGGASWTLVRGLHDHPHRAKWARGNGGLCLHTILPHPANDRKLTVASSAGGVYKSDDAGLTWRASNKGVRADFLPEKYPEFGQCVHKVARDSVNPDRLFMQNHGGLYRSDDDGETWVDIAGGVPSDFGFALAVHPRQESTAYVVPMDPMMRVAPNEAVRVYRTSDGHSWEPLGDGLPTSGIYETVLRDGLCTDTLDPVGIYFGTRSGNVYCSGDEGQS